jgi:hypothetical protein
MSRIKTVFSSHNEVTHIWAQQSQNTGRACNIFFEGPCIYSYGHHYVAGAFIKNKLGEQAVFFNSYTYSVSTAKHMNYIRRAANHVDHSFTVPNMPGPYQIEENGTLASYFDHTANLNYYAKEINAYLAKAKRARENKNFYLSRAGAALSEAIRYINFFDLAITEDLHKINVSYIANDNSFLSAEERQAEKIKAEERAAKLEARHKEDIEDWLNHRVFNLPHTVNRVYLRMKGNMVQTSYGANVPKLEAFQLYRALKNGVDLRGQKIGAYTVIGFDGRILTIGCHKLTIEEIDRFAALHNWPAVLEEKGQIFNIDLSSN